MKGGEAVKANFTRPNAVMLATQQVANPMSEGKFFYNMIEILWSDGATTFGCLRCGEQTTSRPRMSIHIGKTHNKPSKQRKVKKRVYTKRKSEYWARGGNIGSAQAVRNNTEENPTDKIRLLEQERDYWKSEARKARRQLQALLNIK